jgi:hypothetical protein
MSSIILDDNVAGGGCFYFDDPIYEQKHDANFFRKQLIINNFNEFKFSPTLAKRVPELADLFNKCISSITIDGYKMYKLDMLLYGENYIRLMQYDDNILLEVIEEVDRVLENDNKFTNLYNKDE